MEQVGAGPVEDGHEVVADDLDTKLGQVADALLVVFDILVAGGQTDLDIVVHVDGLDNIHIKAVGVDLVCNLLDLVDFPLPSPYQRQPIFIGIEKFLLSLFIMWHAQNACTLFLLIF